MRASSNCIASLNVFLSKTSGPITLLMSLTATNFDCPFVLNQLNLFDFSEGGVHVASLEEEKERVELCLS